MERSPEELSRLHWNVAAPGALPKPVIARVTATRSASGWSSRWRATSGWPPTTCSSRCRRSPSALIPARAGEGGAVIGLRARRHGWGGGRWRRRGWGGCGCAACGARPGTRHSREWGPRPCCDDKAVSQGGRGVGCTRGCLGCWSRDCEGSRLQRERFGG
jgi:hypothetical protein